MSSLIEQIEEMRLRMNEIAGSEQGLVKALGDALARADQQLLNDVQQVTVQHEVRRGVILKELQSLASRIGAFPMLEEPREAPRELAYAEDDVQTGLGRGDWRRAASNIRDELDYHLNGHGHAPPH